MMNGISFFSFTCALIVVASVATLVLRGKYVSTKTIASQTLLVAAMVFALIAFDFNRVSWIVGAGFFLGCYVYRLRSYLYARRISKKYGAQCTHREI